MSACRHHVRDVCAHSDMRILYLTQWFEPEPAFKGLEFAKALAAKGHEVEVATAFPNYPGGKVYPGYRVRPYQRDVMDGITVHRLYVWPSHDRSSVGRMLNYLSFWLSSLFFGLIRGWRYDAVYIYHPPITPALAAALFCRLWRRPFVVEIQDLWPDSVASSGMAPGRIVRALDAACRFTYRRAAAIVAQSAGMMARLEERGVPKAKLHCIRNWSTYAPARDAADLPPEVVRAAFAGRINLVYGGNMGQAQGLRTVIDAVAAAIRTQPDLRLHLHLFGGGIERDTLAARIDELGMAERMTLHGSVSRGAMDRIFDLADILVLHLKADPLYEVTIPSKTQHYLSCGKPIVAGLSGEAADLLRQSGAAIVTAPEDTGAMTAAILSLAERDPAERDTLGKNGRDYYDTHLAFAPAIDRTVAILGQVAGTLPR